MISKFFVIVGAVCMNMSYLAQAQDFSSESSKNDGAASTPFSSSGFDMMGTGEEIIVERDCGSRFEANGPIRSLHANTVEIGVRVAVPQGETPATKGAQIYTRYSCIDPGSRP